MTHYASIGGVRIQTWIARTGTKLSLVRGASILLSQETANTRITAWLAGSGVRNVSVADEAGDVDGVVVLRSDDEEALRDTAEKLIVHLEERIPGLAWEGWLAEGEAYLDAYDAHDATAPMFRSLPPLPELGLVRTCDYCGTEPATQELRIGDDVGHAGPSCRKRKQARDDQQRQARGALWSDVPGTWPETFDDLARRGGVSAQADQAVGRKDSRGHLATVAADGNGIGALFHAISTLGLDDLRKEAVKALNATTRNALSTAARACADDCDVKVVIPHYVGGDDVFASVAAPAIWTFAVNLGRGFEDLRTSLLELVPKGRSDTTDLKAAINRLGLGIGVALAGRSEPISTTREAAHVALAKAKAATSGGESAIGWVDLTADAHTSHVVKVSEVEAELTDLNSVFRLPASARASLAAVVRSDPHDLPSAVDRWASRTGNSVPPEMVTALPATLSRARWWPNLPEETR